MTSIAFSPFTRMRDVPSKPDAPPKHDWPLMCDVACIRAGVPEALIRWRDARGEAPPLPSDPAFRRD